MVLVILVLLVLALVVVVATLAPREHQDVLTPAGLAFCQADNDVSWPSSALASSRNQCSVLCALCSVQCPNFKPVLNLGPRKV